MPVPWCVAFLDDMHHPPALQLWQYCYQRSLYCWRGGLYSTARTQRTCYGGWRSSSYTAKNRTTTSSSTTLLQYQYQYYQQQYYYYYYYYYYYQYTHQQQLVDHCLLYRTVGVLVPGGTAGTSIFSSFVATVAKSWGYNLQPFIVTSN